MSAAGDCYMSPTVNGGHSWRFCGDDPYVACVWCGECRDALTGLLLPCWSDPRPSHKLTDRELRARVNEFTQDDPPPEDLSVGAAG